MEIKQIKEKIIEFIKEHAGNKPVVLGLSGGLDSSVVACLCVQALARDRLHGLVLPSQTNSHQEMECVKELIEFLDVQNQIIGIDEIIHSFKKASQMYKDKNSLGNLKARVRMSLLYGKANELNGLVVGTGNKTELICGYFTKYGDGGVDLLPIGDLYKFQVRELAEHLGVPKKIIDQPPTAGLWAGQTDESELGISYENLDKILQAIENRQNLAGFDQPEVNLVQKYFKQTEHKRKIPPICGLAN
ncbi:MAG: NAD+ synthase [bacterium]